MKTQVAGSIADARRLIAAAKQQGRSVGCVPTMGALHSGHGMLIERARASSDFVVVTIFVNPIQFDRKDDYERYARTFDTDLNFCEQLGVDLIFAPAPEQMYPEPISTYVEVPDVARYLCGEYRPGHFRGVATVVAKLFNIIEPDFAYFGEKDAQQLAVIQHMVRDLNFPVRIVPVPTVREPDGLALSSRNRRLDPDERRAAPVLFKALSEGQRLIADGERNSDTVKSAILRVLASEPLIRPEYVEVVDARMQPVSNIEMDVRISAAAWLGATRLIDNVFCGV
jgi:pantoate--beta-alanine ligase